MINYYKFVKDQQKFINSPSSIIHHPARILIVGSSGSGKTNCLMNLISVMNCFDKFYIFNKMSGSDLLYDNYLIPTLRKVEEKTKEPVLIEYSNTLDDLPEIGDQEDYFDPTKQNLLIFDDMMDEKEKDLKKIRSYFTKMRKKNCTIVFIAQEYFKVPKAIRSQCTDYVFTDTKNNKNLNLIHSELGLGESFEKFNQLFADAIESSQVFIKSQNKYWLHGLQTCRPTRKKIKML